jgi:hypothetical protein
MDRSGIRERLIQVSAEHLADSLLALAKRIDEVGNDYLGVRYLKKLAALGPRIDDWRDFPPHESYKEERCHPIENRRYFRPFKIVRVHARSRTLRSPERPSGESSMRPG